MSAISRQEVVLVAGATGGTGRATIRALMRNNEKSDRSRWIIRALARKPDALKADLDSDLGLNHDVEVVRGDLLSRETLESALAGVSYVIFCAGATSADVKGKPDGSPRVDNEGVANLAAAARITRFHGGGVKQFVLVSSTHVTRPASLVSQILNSIAGNVLFWKLRGENALRRSGVPFTIVRPGQLTTDPAVGFVELSQGDQSGGKTTRDDLAQVLVTALTSSASRNSTFECLSKPATARPAADGAIGATTDAAIFAHLVQEQQAGLASRPDWQRDADVAECAICKAEFQRLLRRRHHCRCCGMIVCDTCSPTRMPILSYAIPNAVRVCKECQPKIASINDVAADPASPGA